MLKCRSGHPGRKKEFIPDKKRVVSKCLKRSKLSNKEAHLKLEQFLKTIRDKRGHIPRERWEVSCRVKRAVHLLLRITKKRPEQLKLIDFDQQGLNGLVHNYNTIYNVLDAAGLVDLNLLERMHFPSNFWDDRSIRTKIIKMMYRKLKEEGRPVTSYEFCQGNLRTLMEHYNFDLFRALFEAGIMLGGDDSASDFNPPQRFMFLPRRPTK